jgi:hypothetical protein
MALFPLSLSLSLPHLGQHLGERFLLVQQGDEVLHRLAPEVGVLVSPLVVVPVVVFRPLRDQLHERLRHRRFHLVAREFENLGCRNKMGARWGRCEEVGRGVYEGVRRAWMRGLDR